MKTCTGAEQETCNVEKMGCKGCYYESKELVNQIDIQKFIKLLQTGTITIDYSPVTMQYSFIDKNGNAIEVDPKTYLNIVNYIEKGEIYD